MTKLTFIDAGVLIYAARGESQIALKALEVLQDNNRIFASSIFLKMEVLSKAIYNQQSDEIEFYNEYFKEPAQQRDKAWLFQPELIIYSLFYKTDHTSDKSDIAQT